MGNPGTGRVHIHIRPKRLGKRNVLFTVTGRGNQDKRGSGLRIMLMPERPLERANELGVAPCPPLRISDNVAPSCVRRWKIPSF
jgi:hypothetical protein